MHRAKALVRQLVPEAFSRGTFRRFVPVSTRVSDVDVYGHVNNVHYGSYMDSAVNSLLVEEGGLDMRGGDVIGVIAESHYRYLSEARFPQRLDVGVRVGHLGNSSVRYEMAVFPSAADPGDSAGAMAAGEFVHVFVDRRTRRPVPIPGPVRRVLERLGDEFARQAAGYASFRPTYPAALVDALCAAYAADPRRLPGVGDARAVDVGCGSGQLAAELARRGFGSVLGVDKSPKQLENADRSSGAEYALGTEVDLGGAADGSAHLVTAAQAAHWFDLGRFYAEARRVAAPGGAALALAGYGLCRVVEPAPLDAVFRRYYGSLERYWPGACNRRLLDDGFASADPAPPFEGLERRWFPERDSTTVGAFLGYLRTWSAYNALLKEGAAADPMPAFEAEVRRAVGSDDDSAPMVIEWPFWLVTMRL